MEKRSTKILAQLQKYQGEKKKLTLLWHEWENPVIATPKEMLEVMAFSREMGGASSQTGHISDKTPQIAITYKERAARSNQEERQELLMQIERLEQRMQRLEYCVSQLPQDQRAVITGLYFEGKGQRELIDELHLSVSTLQRYRDRAVISIAGMYEVLQEAGVEVDW